MSFLSTGGEPCRLYDLSTLMPSQQQLNAGIDITKDISDQYLRWEDVHDKDQELKAILDELQQMNPAEHTLATTERLAAHLHIAVFPIIDTARDSTDYAINQCTDTIYHSFPVNVVGYSPTVATGTCGIPSGKPVKFRKQWCVLDGHTLSYYKSGSTSSVQGSIVMSSLVRSKTKTANCSSGSSRVELILPPFVHSSSVHDPTSRLLAIRFDNNSGGQVEVVSGASSSILTIFCETIEERNRWEQAIRNRINMSSTANEL